MAFFIILLMVAFITFYLTPFIFETIQVSFPFVIHILKVRNTIVFGLIGIVFSLQIEPFPVMNLFLGMIAGSFVDYLIREQA